MICSKYLLQLVPRIVLTFLVVFIATPLQAYQVQVPEPHFTPETADISRVVYVSNDTDKITPITLVAKRSDFTIGGKEVLTETDDFLIYPNKLLLRPGEKVVVSVRYLGDMDIDQERAYRLVTEEVNFADRSEEKKQATSGKATASIGIRYRYVNRLYVTPDHAEPAVTVVSVKTIKKDGRPQLRVKVTNNGTAHAIVNGFTIRFQFKSAENKDKPYTRTIIFPQHKAGKTNVLPKKSRYIYYLK